MSYFHDFKSYFRNISFRFIYPINCSIIKIIARKLLSGDMDQKYLDHNPMNTICGGKSGIELEQSGQNICAAVKGVLGYM